MEHVASHRHTVLALIGGTAPLNRLTAPSMTGAAFAVHDGPVATMETLRADGGWMIAQADLLSQLA